MTSVNPLNGHPLYGIEQGASYAKFIHSLAHSFPYDDDMPDCVDRLIIIHTHTHTEGIFGSQINVHKICTYHYYLFLFCFFKYMRTIELVTIIIRRRTFFKYVTSLFISYVIYTEIRRIWRPCFFFFIIII